jgi:hypothetical protein
MAVSLPPIPLIVATVSLRLQHESYSKFIEESIQRIIFSFTPLNLPKRRHVPNATRRHTFSDLPPQFIIRQTEASTVCPLLSPPFLFTNFLERMTISPVPSASRFRSCGVHRQMPSPLVIISTSPRTRILPDSRAISRTWFYIMFSPLAATSSKFIGPVRRARKPLA